MKAFFFFVLILAVFVTSGLAGNMSDAVRPPAVAGQFYPDSPEALKGAVQKFLSDAVPRTAVKPIAIVVPHAGYIFSGQIAADGFKQAEGESCEVVVILGTNHTTPGFQKISVYNGRGFRTPLGVAEIDREIAAALLKADPDCVAEEGVHRNEHSI
jgi:AmmeMemoRadiSam system protein B